MADALTELARKYRRELLARSVNLGQASRQEPTPEQAQVAIQRAGGVEALPKPPVPRAVDLLPNSMLGGAVGLAAGGPIGGVAGAVLPYALDKLEETSPENAREVNRAMEAMAFLPMIAGAGAEAKAAKAGSTLDRLINAKNSVYHSTDLPGFKGILSEGKILPRAGVGLNGELSAPGVSVARIPNKYANGAITFVLDQEKLPQAKPFVEPGFEKVNSWGDPSGRFEHESRTLNEPIGLEATRGILVSRPRLKLTGHSIGPEISHEDAVSFIKQKTASDPGFKDWYWEQPSGNPQDVVRPWLERHPEDWKKFGYDPQNLPLSKIEQQILALAEEKGLPVRFYNDSKELSNYRAKMSELYKQGKPLFGLGAAGLVEAFRRSQDKKREESDQ